MGPLDAHSEGAPPVSLWRDRRLWLLVAAAAILRLIVGLDLWAHDPTMRALLSDSRYYLDWAKALAGGAEFSSEGPGKPYWMPPLYPYALAGIGASIRGMLLLQAALGLGTLVLLARLTERLFTPALGAIAARKAALWSGLLWTLYAPVLFFENRLLGVTFAIFLATLALDLAIRLLSRPRLPLAIAAGVACGLLALVRPNTLLSIPAIALAILLATRADRKVLKTGLALTAGFALAALLTVAPALAKNHAAEGEWIPLTANSGINFYFGNNAEAHGTFHAPGPEWGSIEAQRQTSINLAQSALGRELTTGEAASYWYGEGLDWLAAEPAAAAKLWGLKLADSLSSTEFGIQYNLRASREVAPTLWAAPLPFGVLLFLAILGAAVLRRGGFTFRKEGLVLGAWLAAGLIGALLYFTYSRFRLPLLPALVPLAGLGAMSILGAHKPKPAALLLASALLIQSFFAFEGTYPQHLRSHAFVDMAHAVEANAIQDRESDATLVRSKALAFLDRALATIPGNKPALVMRGRLLQYSDQAGALDSLEQAYRLPIADPLADYWLARLLIETPLTERRDLTRALQIAQTWLDINGNAHALAPDFQVLIDLTE
jgi:4-amino-4-deoxy-L-arabinose transferase-like glycosyltransferase